MKYSLELERTMQLFYNGLSEKDQRHYAAQEALKLSWGGKSYISQLFQISPRRVRQGILELQNPSILGEIPAKRQRRLGSGRKKKEVTAPDAIAAFSLFIDRYKASSPTDATVYWVSLKPKDLSALFFKETGFKLSHSLVKRLLKDLGFGYRKLSKNLAIGTYADRDKQFQIIFQLVAIMCVKSPVLSIDCKKKERLGNLYRAGKSYSTAPIKVYDHDYEYLGEGKVIPHGIYDMQRNEGYMTIGSSHETAAFIKDNLLWWWSEYGQFFYPEAKNMLILCDAGGANGHRNHVFKKEIQQLAKKIGLDIIICHYPPYASKWNPIEHRLFAHVHKAMQGVVLSNYNLVKQLIENTKTKTGLKVIVRVNIKDYPIGIKTTKEEVIKNRIQFNKTLENLSYRIAA